jgi:signal peptidase
VLVALFFVLIILLALWVYTGQWFGTPLVAIESGSMMHENEPFGRIGTIDAGDMVLLVKVDEKSDVKTFSTSEDYAYGRKGDVVIYHPDGKENLDQIIHRAMCWVEVEFEGDDKFYTIEEYGIIHQESSESIYIPECGIWDPSSNSSVKLNFQHSGFITKGDNPNTNPTCDQLGGISRQPIKIEWISGRASLELPWIGTINLLFNDLTNGKNTLGNIPQDSLICFGILIAFLISIPVSLDIYSYYQERKSKK